MLDKQTAKICLEAVKQNEDAIQYVEPETVGIRFVAVDQNGSPLYRVTTYGSIEKKYVMMLSN